MSEYLPMWSNPQQSIASGIFPAGTNTHLWPNIWAILDLAIEGDQDAREASSRIRSALERAFGEVDGLSNRYVGPGSDRHCVAGREPRFSITVTDERKSWDEIRTLVGTSVFRAADLEDGPLAWADAFVTPDGEWVALIVFDHVSADGFGLDLFERAFLGYVRGRKASPIRPSLPHQRALLESDAYRTAHEHYRRLWSIEHERPAYLEAQPSTTPTEHRFPVDGARYQLLEALARESKMSLPHVVQLLVTSWLADLSDSATFLAIAHHGRTQETLGLVADLASYDYIGTTREMQTSLAAVSTAMDESPHLWGAFWPGEVAGYREAQRRLSLRLNVVPRGRSSMSAKEGSGATNRIFTQVEKIDWDNLASGPYQPHDEFVPYVHVWVEPHQLVASVFAESTFTHGIEIFEEPFSEKTIRRHLRA